MDAKELQEYQEQRRQIKTQVKQEIIDTINRICTSNPDTCTLGYCQFNQKCAKPFFEVQVRVAKNIRLKSMLRQVSKEKRKHTDKRNRNHQTHRSHHIRISEILGQDIYEHELVRGNSGAIETIKVATSLKNINKVLTVLYFEKYGKHISVPQGRAHYRKYLGENYTQVKN